MAEKNKQTNRKKKGVLIDPIYQKFTRSILRAISSTEFYAYFMDALSRAENEFQFSNRKLEKAVDLNWVDKIEQTLPAIQNIISNPRNMIKEEEVIVNAANAKRSGPDVVRHLSQHAAYVEDYNTRTGDVRPSKLMQKYREDSEELYENRLIFTTMEMAYQFVRIRHDALFEAMSDEYGAKLRIQSNMESATEQVHMDMFLHIKEIESAIDTDERNTEVFARISRLYRLLSTFMNSAFAKQMAKINRVKGTIYKTNVLKKNPDYRKVAQLLEFLRGYSDVGYSIKVIEQAPEINEAFQTDIYHNILFNYMVLKGYLQDESDRVVPVEPKQKKRTLRPKFIRQIIEELTEDYDLPDIEIRKVLIEELTKEQLMLEEAEERRRLVEEQQKRKQEEEERIRKEKEAEEERIRQEQEAEAERIRQEKKKEKQKLHYDQMLQDTEERRRSGIFRKELQQFTEKLQDQKETREKVARIYAAEQEDFADIVKRLEEAEKDPGVQKARKKELRKEEKEQLLQQKKLEKQRQQQEKLRQQQDKLRQEEENQQKQIAQDKEYLHPYYIEVQRFMLELAHQKEAREAYQREQIESKKLLEQQRQKILASRQAAK